MRLRECAIVAILCGVAACATPAEPVTESERAVTFALGGDVMFGRWSKGARIAYSNPKTWDQARTVLGKADLAVVNLETAACSDDVSRAASRDANIQLTARPHELATLERAGVDVASVANNHATDCGPDSVTRTSAALSEVGVEAVGLEGEAFRTRVRDVDVVVVGATLFRPPIAPGRGEVAPWYVPRGDFGEIVGRVERLRTDAPDAVLLVSIHWGVEGGEAPTAWQRERARELVDAGADVVHGHGSHTVQAVEQYRGGAIAYGLGNLHFDMRRGSSSERAVAVVRCGERCEVELTRLGRVD